MCYSMINIYFMLIWFIFVIKVMSIVIAYIASDEFEFL